ncbi:hypothetical protein [Kitasatospora sp. NPDC094011]|uniref:hypothetical protein n=1 Tax=Kitasatospora sp. NPDC094011 TaxID=3364090 RepID=UPI00381098E7
MRVTELLRAHAAELDQDFPGHDPADFTRRLAERLVAARRAAPTGRERPARPPAVARPPHAPATGDHPRTGGRSELRRDLRHLCAGVAGAVEPGELALDLELAEKAAFRTLGCLLYGLGRTADGVFWWRIAAQYGDPLAVHCLAVHYAAEGERHDAARWAAEAEDLSGPGRLPEVAPAARPGRVAELARLLAEGYDGEILLTLQGAVAARPGADPGRLGVRAVRGRGVVRIR